MRSLLATLLLMIAAPAHAAEKGDLVLVDIACKGPSIVSSIADAAEISLEGARTTLEAAILLKMCYTGQFVVTLEEKTRWGTDASGMGYELWTVSGGGMTAYTFILIGYGI